MSTPGTEKVFPAAPAPPSPGAGAGGGSSNPLKGIDRKWLLGGAAAVTVLLAATVGRRDADADPDPEGEDGGAPYELDTQSTDLYNELQPELEQIGDALEQLGDRPRPPKPTPPRPGNPQGPGGGPRPGGGAPVSGTHRVKQGDTLRSIAKDRKVRGGAPRLYAVNRNIIKRAAIAHKDPRPNGTRKLYPGTVLVIP